MLEWKTEIRDRKVDYSSAWTKGRKWMGMERNVRKLKRKKRKEKK